ncbi:lipopolysaccharide heptosyltransferase I [Solimicrobium silvestre]|uniref:Lipopolysaccharide heptosyltransferase 1 n=1 Tax=Solimicrobium silvestre TaxID=2099400 RepID=A0A2S9H4Q9_9BURK|nr:lipopolysaccharide heptosyltransferase I [Solimicrobium silvestre]PRC94923.1 Lipopolysaccharide heptosyltransferase I [Solimicrobium silvestre]
MKVLLIRVSSMGDVLHNMPIVADILRNFPHAQIDWVVEENFVELVRLNPNVHKIIPFALRRWRKGLLSASVRAEMSAFKKTLRLETYDVILDTQGLLKTGVIMGLAQGGAKVGLANGTEGSGYEAASRIFHTLSVPVGIHTHAVLRGRIVAAHALGYMDKIENVAPDFGLLAPNPDLQPDWLPQNDYAVFFHGTAGAAKKWPAHDWITLGKHLNARNYPILLAWGNRTEQLEAEQLASHIPNAQVLPKLSMMEAIILAQRAAIVIGVDTGLTHIAAAYCRPTVEIYSASPRWKTEGNWSDKIINLGDKGAPPGVADVIAAVDSLI